MFDLEPNGITFENVENVRVGNCPRWELSVLKNCPGWELFVLGIVRVGNCPGVGNVRVGNCPRWKLCPDEKCPIIRRRTLHKG